MFLYFAFNLSDILNPLNTISTTVSIALLYVMLNLPFNSVFHLVWPNSFSKYFLST